MWSLELARWSFGGLIAATALAWVGHLILCVVRSLWCLYFHSISTSVKDDAGRFGRLVLSGEALASCRKALQIAEANPLLRFPAYEQILVELEHALKRSAICDGDCHATREIHRELRKLRSHYKQKLRTLTIEVPAIDMRKLIVSATPVKGMEKQS